MIISYIYYTILWFASLKKKNNVFQLFSSKTNSIYYLLKYFQLKYLILFGLRMGHSAKKRCFHITQRAGFSLFGPNFISSIKRLTSEMSLIIKHIWLSIIFGNLTGTRIDLPRNSKFYTSDFNPRTWKHSKTPYFFQILAVIVSCILFIITNNDMLTGEYIPYRRRDNSWTKMKLSSNWKKSYSKLLT